MTDGLKKNSKLEWSGGLLRVVDIVKQTQATSIMRASISKTSVNSESCCGLLIAVLINQPLPVPEK